MATVTITLRDIDNDNVDIYFKSDGSGDLSEAEFLANDILLFLEDLGIVDENEGRIFH